MRFTTFSLLISGLILLDSSCFSQQKTEFMVSANELFQTTSISVEKGETYQIKAEGEWQDASFPPTDGNGFKGFTVPMFFGTFLKPMPSQHYMKLCGKVGNWKFPIGTFATVTMKRSGKLFLFPNDAKGFFDNNNGTLKVTVTKVDQ